MRSIFEKGDKKEHLYVVKTEDVAAFESGLVHPVCSTFTLAREMEWAGRLFVLDMKEVEEEGIGTSLQIAHLSPAFPGDRLTFTAEYQGTVEGEIRVTIKVKKGDRLIATGNTGQRILPRKKIQERIEIAKQS